MVIIVIPLSQPLLISRLARKQGFCCVLGMFLRTRAALCWECCHITVLHYLLHYCHVSSRSSGPGQHCVGSAVTSLCCIICCVIVMSRHVPQDQGSTVLGVLSHHCVALFVALLSCLVTFLRTRAALCWECCHITELHYLLHYCHVSSRSSGPGQHCVGSAVTSLCCIICCVIVMSRHVPQDQGSTVLGVLSHHCVALFVALLSCLVTFLRTRAALCWECCHITVLHYLLHYCHVSSCSSGPGQHCVGSAVTSLCCIICCIIVMSRHVPQDQGSTVHYLLHYCHVSSRSSGPGQHCVGSAVTSLCCIICCVIVMSLHVPQDLGSTVLGVLSHHCVALFVALLSCLVTFLRTRAALCWECCHITVLHYLLHYCHVSSCSSGPGQHCVGSAVTSLCCIICCVIVMSRHVPQDLGSVMWECCHVTGISLSCSVMFLRTRAVLECCHWYIIAMSWHVPQDPGSVMLECCHVTGISLSYLVTFPRTWAMWRLAARSLRPSWSSCASWAFSCHAPGAPPSPPER